MLISEGSMIERSVDEDPSTILTRYEATAIASVLEECVDQLAVLQHAIPAEIDDRWDDIVKPIKEKYGALEEPHIIIREETNLPPLILSKAAKLQRDRTYMYKILKMTLDEIKRYQKFDILKEEVNDIMKMLEDEYNLKETCMFWENQVNQLRQLIKDETNKQEREKRQLLKLAQMTKAKVDDTVYEMALKMGYVNKWENARFTQHLFKLTTEEQNLLNEIDEYRKKQIVEKIVTEKICAYYQESIKDMENEMLTWSNRYDDEIEQRQRDINDLKTKIEEQKLEIQDLRIMKDERQAFIDENLAEIRRLEEEAKYQAILHRAATIIQAAIRGYFVRHELGEYKNLRAQLRKRKKLAAAKRRKLEAQRKKLEEEEMKKLKDTRLKTGKIK
ncbi:dynein regulatory complex protein 9-like isoform X2 [Vespa velutina]|uniref:dynein regulatory complex protein 9-like isoform X2 n=1 Tax=Vespa velutina TaxID=202808 RepID=UPI001FB4218B|nr:dynein regulatory complex protein 9-like isoform X2 [Vespa velutina]